MRNIIISVALLIAIPFCTSCQMSGVGVAPSTTPITENDTYTVIGKARGTSFGILLYVLPISEPDNSGVARDRAISNSGGDALIEVAETFHWLNLIFITLIWTDCEGTAVKINKDAALNSNK